MFKMHIQRVHIAQKNIAEYVQVAHSEDTNCTKNITEYVQDAHSEIANCTKYYRICARCTLKLHTERMHIAHVKWRHQLSGFSLGQYHPICCVSKLNIEYITAFLFSLMGLGSKDTLNMLLLPSSTSLKSNSRQTAFGFEMTQSDRKPKVSSFNQRSFPDLLLGQCNVRQDPIWRKSRRCICHQLQRNTKLSPVLDKANWCKNNCSPDAKLRRHILAADALPANEGVNRFFMDAFLLTSRRDHICIMFGLHQALLQHKTSRLKSMCRLSSSCTEH